MRFLLIPFSLLFFTSLCCLAQESQTFCQSFDFRQNVFQCTGFVQSEFDRSRKQIFYIEKGKNGFCIKLAERTRNRKNVSFIYNFIYDSFNNKYFSCPYTIKGLTYFDTLSVFESRIIVKRIRKNQNLIYDQVNYLFDVREDSNVKISIFYYSGFKNGSLELDFSQFATNKFLYSKRIMEYQILNNQWRTSKVKISGSQNEGELDIEGEHLSQFNIVHGYNTIFWLIITTLVSY